MKKKVVVFGGGTGLSSLLRGLKDFPVEITAVITVSDDGRSTGKLREEFSIPAVGDLRKVLSNLSELPKEVKDVMEYRFRTYSDLNEHAVGNLVLTALLNKTGSLRQSIEYMSTLLDVKHRVLPLSEDCLTLMGETESGEIIEGEAALTHANQHYKRIFYKEKPHVLEEVLAATQEADLIILSMGSLFTSLLPHLICEEVREAIQNTSAPVMYLCNAMTQPGETDDFYVSDHIKLIESYLGQRTVQVVVTSNTQLPKEVLKKYETEEQKDQVMIDHDQLQKMGVELIESDLLTTEDDVIRHDSLKLSALVFAYLMR